MKRSEKKSMSSALKNGIMERTQPKKVVQMQGTADLSTSKLGTKKYWDELYALELENFRRNPQDTGDCWFSDSDAEQKMIDFLVDNIGAYRISENASVVDLGTGNGHMLFELHQTEFQGKLVGIDYSEESVKLASNIAEATGVDNFISFQQADIFSGDWKPGKYDIVLDKGTLDAISLSGMKINGKLDVVDVYAGVVEKILEKDGIFLITSCNFTQDELVKIIETDNLKMWKTIKYPVFQFGGVQGATICSVAFVKQN